MKKFYVLMFTVFLNIPFFYSCNPDAAYADDGLYLEQAGDDDEEIIYNDPGRGGDDDEPILPTDDDY